MSKIIFEFIEPKEEPFNINESENNPFIFHLNARKCGDIQLVQNKDGTEEFFLTCILCDNSFKNLTMFTNHFLHNHKKDPETKLCDEQQQEGQDIDTELLTKSLNLNDKIDHSDSSFNDDNDDNNGAFTRTKLSATDDSLKKTKINNFKGKRRQQTKHSDIDFVCKSCNKKCPNQSYLLRHIASHTPNIDRPYKCQYCPKAFNYKNHLNRHQILHTKDRIFECDYCYMKFTQNNERLIHLAQHSDIDKQNVIKYGKKLARKNIDSTTNSNNEVINEFNDVNHDRMVPDGYWRCNICEKILKNSYKQEDHLRLHTGEKPYICDICGKGMVSQAHLNHHILVHNKDRRYKCSQCTAGFYSSAHLRRHELASHSIEKPFKCEFCSMGFGRKEHLSSHQLTHNKNRTKNFKCNICENSYYDMNALRIHKKKHLATDGPYMCSLCPAGFESKEALKRHEKRHINKGKYKCDYCDKCFNDKDDQHQHEKRCHYNKETEHLIDCHACTMKFMRKYDLKQHYEKMHSDNLNFNT